MIFRDPGFASIAAQALVHAPIERFEVGVIDS